MSSGTSTEASPFHARHFFVILTMLAATAAVLLERETSFANLILVSLTVMASGLVAFAAHRMVLPLFSRELENRMPAALGRTRLALEREKTLVLRSIKELEFDQAMGKIAESDFQDMSSRLRTRAIGLMRQLDEQHPGWRAEIESELERRLAASVQVQESPAAPVGEPVRVAPGPACSVCGTASDLDARFCKQCGNRLEATPATPVVEA